MGQTDYGHRRAAQPAHTHAGLIGTVGRADSDAVIAYLYGIFMSVILYVKAPVVGRDKVDSLDDLAAAYDAHRTAGRGVEREKCADSARREYHCYYDYHNFIFHIIISYSYRWRITAFTILAHQIATCNNNYD